MAFEQHAADGGGDGQFHPQTLPQGQRGARAAHPFGGHAAGQDIFQRAAFADSQADLAVARQRPGGGQHKVAQAC